MPVYDLVIHSADIVDGTGRGRMYGSVAIRDGRILCITPGEASAEKALATIDAKGCVLSPGFIDVHSHDDFAAFLRPELGWKLLQGVTTQVVGNCGIGAAPFPGALDWFTKLHPAAPHPEYRDYRGYFQALEEARPSANVAVLAGHGALRNAAAPGSRGPLDTLERSLLSQALEEALAAGVVGLSAGLIYEPGLHADQDELVSLAEQLRGIAPLFTVHLRSEADDLLIAVREALLISERAGVGLQLSHHKAHGRNNWGRVKESLALVDRARARGQDVWIDQYPYTAGSTILQAIIDRGGLSGGPALGELRPEDIVMASSSKRPDWEGKSLRDLSREMGASPTDTAEIVLGEDPGIWVVVHAMSEEDVQTVLKHPATLVGSDGLPTDGGRPHPRLYGTFPRILGHYVREARVLGLEDAIAKMTGRAARRFNLVGRGTISEGAWADLVLFDESRIAAGATFDEPTRAPIGVSGVWVNGVRTVDEQGHTGARAGQILRRHVES